MKRTNSVEIIVNNLEQTAQKIEKDDETRITLRRTFSDDLPRFQSENLVTTPTKNPKNKTLRSRFSFGFRSLRGSRLLARRQSFSAGAIQWSEKSLQTQSVDDTPSYSASKVESFEKQHLSPSRAEKKKFKITKKFSLNSIRRQKVKPREDNLVTSATQTPNHNQRSTAKSRHLSLSQINLVNIPSGEEEAENSARVEQVRKIQITISGRKALHCGSAPTSISGDDYFTASSNPSSLDIQSETALNSRDQDSTKLNITQSERDTPPRERAPVRPNVVYNNNSSIVASNESSPLNSTPDNKGAIRKHPHSARRLERQLSHDELFEHQNRHQLMQREVSLDRGRRFPRPAYIDQSALPDSPQHQEKLNRIQDYVDKTCIGKNLANQNISESIEDNQQTEEVSTSKITFSIGRAVRGSNTPLLRQAVSDSKEFSSIESANSTGSYSPVSDTARRRIRYIGQPTFYTDEEREILEGKRMPLGNLSGISENSFESNCSGETQMPAFGDLTMDVEEAPIMTSGTEKREHLYKILVIGELGTGKTSFIKRYVHQFFSANYRATIGVDFALKVLHWDQNTIVRLQLWDIAGQERFGNMTRVYYKEAVGAFIVFDVTRSGTFDAVSKWKEDLDSKVQLPDGSPIPCILLANKCDQEKQGIITTPDKMDEYVKENGFAGWFETSAKENINIEEAARALVNKILLNDKLITAADILDNDKFAIGSNTSQQHTSAGKKNCSC